MLERLKELSKRLDKRRDNAKFLQQVQPYFETKIYEDAGVLVCNDAEGDKDSSGRSSTSYKSGRLYSDNSDSEKDAA